MKLIISDEIKYNQGKKNHKDYEIVKYRFYLITVYIDRFN